MRWLLEPYADPATYRAFGHLLAGLALGTFEFVVVVTGLSLGLGLVVVWVGVPVLVATLLLVSGLASFERDLAVSMLGAAMPREVRRRDAPGFGWRRLWARTRDRRTWSEVAFLLLRLPLGIAGFTVAVTIAALALWVVVEPTLIAVGVSVEYGGWTPSTSEAVALLAPISVLFLLVGPRLVLAWAGLTGRITTRMLGWVDGAAVKQAVVEILTDRGPMDGFALFDELGLRLGRGPFLTPTKLEATLVTLESAGHVNARRDGRRTTYSRAIPAPVP